LGIPIIYISERDIPEQVRNLIEADVVMLYRVVPIEERGDALVVATSTPESKLNLDNVSRLIGCPVAPVITTSDEIDFVLRRYYGLTQ
jgi:type IV pilus assembly protein PilB